ncbi:hypothetical protein TBK1r_41610 [Stieleria magnilauensis]|uniref:Uncharacterized protein n=1 Tax=Stieleria magnilauensis TaxID=2527963 RepID=A0ABX5XT80_9BACT|nr:hypothetical protein TBK1r_41610 [Planctomycetes bacterium TBK1r]
MRRSDILPWNSDRLHFSRESCPPRTRTSRPGRSRGHRENWGQNEKRPRAGLGLAGVNWTILRSVVFQKAPRSKRSQRGSVESYQLLCQKSAYLRVPLPSRSGVCGQEHERILSGSGSLPVVNQRNSRDFSGLWHAHGRWIVLMQHVRSSGVNGLMHPILTDPVHARTDERDSSNL